LTLGYQIFMGWVADKPALDEPGRQSDRSPAE
jgi:hypothetical protein